MVVGPSSFPISWAPIFGAAGAWACEGAGCQARSNRAERLIPATPVLRKKSRRDNSLSMTTSFGHSVNCRGESHLCNLARKDSAKGRPGLKIRRPSWRSFGVPALSDVSIQPLDIILFRGTDWVSHAICFLEGKMFGHGDFSHAGVVVTREALDLPFLEPDKVYVWESTLSAPAGFLAHFTDKVPDRESEGVRF